MDQAAQPQQPGGSSGTQQPVGTQQPPAADAAQQGPNLDETTATPTTTKAAAKLRIRPIQVGMDEE
eukprot:10424389-Lingulodinium_polyedra.AAC.1